MISVVLKRRCGAIDTTECLHRQGYKLISTQECNHISSPNFDF